MPRNPTKAELRQQVEDLKKKLGEAEERAVEAPEGRGEPESLERQQVLEAELAAAVARATRAEEMPVVGSSGRGTCRRAWRRWR